MAQRGVNSVTIVGNLGADPEVKNNVTSIRVATTDAWKDKETQEQQERTEWHRIKAFGGLAKIIGDYAKKGRQVYVRGSLRTDKYTDKDGVERFSTEIIAEEFQLLGSNPDRQD